MIKKKESPQGPTVMIRNKGTGTLTYEGGRVKFTERCTSTPSEEGFMSGPRLIPPKGYAITVIEANQQEKKKRAGGES